MIRPALFSAFCVVVTACGSAPPPPQTSGTTTTPTTAATTGECYATLTNHRPEAGWVESGTLKIAIKDGEPTSLDIVDPSGMTLESRPVPKGLAHERKVFETAVCRLGGLIARLDGPEPSKTATTTITLIVYKPAKPDENADVAMMCKDFPPMPDADTSQMLRIAAQSYEENLTTTKWRGWLHDLGSKLGAEADDAARLRLQKSAADDLDKAAPEANVAGACWLSSNLRRQSE